MCFFFVIYYCYIWLLLSYIVVTVLLDVFTQVTERYVQKALVELLAVVIDQRQYEANIKRSSANNTTTTGTVLSAVGTNKPDLGGWECIYKVGITIWDVHSFFILLSIHKKGPIIWDASCSFWNWHGNMRVFCFSWLRLTLQIIKFEFLDNQRWRFQAKATE